MPASEDRRQMPQFVWSKQLLVCSQISEFSLVPSSKKIRLKPKLSLCRLVVKKRARWISSLLVLFRRILKEEVLFHRRTTYCKERKGWIAEVVKYTLHIALGTTQIYLSTHSDFHIFPRQAEHCNCQNSLFHDELVNYKMSQIQRKCGLI